jgi:hypothetical protein
VGNVPSTHLSRHGLCAQLFHVFTQLLHNDVLSSRYTVLTTLRLAASRESVPGVA